jgi:hypothetical protein
VLIMQDMNKVPEKTVPFQIREFPDRLARRIRAEATLAGKTTREIAIETFEQRFPEPPKEAEAAERQPVEVER